MFPAILGGHHGGRFRAPWHTCGVFHVRVSLPDRPGSLGAVATALGRVGADIAAVEIIEKVEGGSVINDFVLELPADVMPDSVITECAELEGVRVMWMSRVPANWGLESDLMALERMLAEPSVALQRLTEDAPRVFNAQWALALGEQGTPLAATALAPELGPEQLSLLGPFDQPHASELASGWMPSWADTAVAVAPASQQRVIILGRPGGPVFLESEVRRLHHLASMA